MYKNLFQSTVNDKFTPAAECSNPLDLVV